MKRDAFELSLALITAMLAGCSPPSPSGTPDAGTPAPMVPCASVCAARLQECGAPPMGDPCAQTCATLTTAAQVACLGSSTCAQLASEFEAGRVPCAQPSETDAGACDPSVPPACDGNAIVRCETIAGRPTRSTQTCQSGTRCENARCVSTTMCQPLGTTGCTDGSCCAGTVCFSSGPPDAPVTSCCVQQGNRCANNNDCCGFDASARYTNRCVSGTCTLSL